MKRALIMGAVLAAATTAWAQDPKPAEGPKPAADAPKAAPATETPKVDVPADATPAPAEGGETPAAEGTEAAEGEATEAPAPEPAPAPAPAVVDTDKMAALEARIEELQSQLEEQRDQLTKTQRKLIPDDSKLEFTIEGYYRTRGHIFPNLFEGQERHARYFNQRLRMRPMLNYRDLAKAMFQIDALDGVIWGDNSNLATTPLFAADPSNNNLRGTSQPSMRLTQAWMEFNIPVGLLRVGRQPSHWGMGLLAHDGNGFEDKFGEFKYGNQFDRVIFGTRPLAILDAATGMGGADIPLIFAVGVDRLVEDPEFQYYGYECELGEPVDENSPCDNDGDGVSDEDHSWTDEERSEDNRGQDWWADQDDDVWEMIYALIYRGDDVDYLGGTGDLHVGAYLIQRKQNETNSNVVIADVYFKAHIHGIYAEFEGLTIQGKSEAISLPGSINLDPGANPLYKEPNIWGWVGRLGYKQANYSAIFETGFASGDDNVADLDFTGRPLHPDHNVGLLLYEEIIARVTSELWSDGAEALWSSGGIYNSRYIFPTASYSPIDNWTLLAGYVMAWPHKPDGRFIQCVEGEDCAQARASSKSLGWELDFAVKHRFHEHVLFSLETGYAHATDRLPLAAAGLQAKDDGTGNYFTFQSRMAYEF